MPLTQEETNCKLSSGPSANIRMTESENTNKLSNNRYNHLVSSSSSDNGGGNKNNINSSEEENKNSSQGPSVPSHGIESSAEVLEQAQKEHKKPKQASVTPRSFLNKNDSSKLVSSSGSSSGEGPQGDPRAQKQQPGTRKPVAKQRKDGRKYIQKNSLTEEELRAERDRIRAKLESKKQQQKRKRSSEDQDNGDKAAATEQISEDDILADRRAANRLSAFQSRQRRKLITEELEKTVTSLKLRNTEQAQEIRQLQQQIIDLQKENYKIHQELSNNGQGQPSNMAAVQAAASVQVPPIATVFTTTAQLMGGNSNHNNREGLLPSTATSQKSTMLPMNHTEQPQQANVVPQVKPMANGNGASSAKADCTTTSSGGASTGGSVGTNDGNTTMRANPSDAPKAEARASDTGASSQPFAGGSNTAFDKYNTHSNTTNQTTNNTNPKQAEVGPATANNEMENLLAFLLNQGIPQQAQKPTQPPPQPQQPLPMNNNNPRTEPNYNNNNNTMLQRPQSSSPSGGFTAVNPVQNNQTNDSNSNRNSNSESRPSRPNQQQQQPPEEMLQLLFNLIGNNKNNNNTGGVSSTANKTGSQQPMSSVATAPPAPPISPSPSSSVNPPASVDGNNSQQQEQQKQQQQPPPTSQQAYPCDPQLNHATLQAPKPPAPPQQQVQPKTSGFQAPSTSANPTFPSFMNQTSAETSNTYSMMPQLPPSFPSTSYNPQQQQQSQLPYPHNQAMAATTTAVNAGLAPLNTTTTTTNNNNNANNDFLLLALLQEHFRMNKQQQQQQQQQSS